jgi:excisionase family DNA binding protein
LNLRPLGPEPATDPVHGVAGDGRASQALDDTGIDPGEVVEGLPPDPPNGTDGNASGEQVAADLRRTDFLRPEGLLPVAAVAKRLGLSASTVHDAISAGKLRAVLFGSVRRVRPEELEAYMRSREASRPPAGEDWCTVAELRRALGCSRAHAYRLLARGAVPFAVFGGTRYIRKRDLEHVLHAECHTDTVSSVQVSFSRAGSASSASARLVALLRSRRTAPGC